MEQISINNDTIAAISTPPGKGGIAVIRVSGNNAVNIVNSAWKGADLTKVNSHTAHLGKYISIDDTLLDEALATVFLAPNSFTGENIVELSLHGSLWIQREILNDLTKRGVRIASPGEFTQRAFLNGKMDLAQAEGVADLIASSSKASHDLALSQTKGSFSKEFNILRDKLIEFASLMELELDFSEEDVEFADRSALTSLCEEILNKVNKLARSYSTGAVLKNGVPVVIAGIPNAGKSSLLNLLLNDEKAIVTDIPGTTRDIIEDTVEIDGVLYRFIDTAGLRNTNDIVEEIGVKRAKEAIEKAFINIWVIDTQTPLDPQLTELLTFLSEEPSKKTIILLNKSDLDPLLSKDVSEKVLFEIKNKLKGRTELELDFPIPFSTITNLGLLELKSKLNKFATANQNPETDIIITNARHYDALNKASVALNRVKEGLDSKISSDLIAQDIREAISYLSSLTGTITTNDLLHSIFSRFCIGK